MNVGLTDSNVTVSQKAIPHQQKHLIEQMLLLTSSLLYNSKVSKFKLGD